MTPHLRSLGAVEIRRHEYLEHLDAAVRADRGARPASTLQS